MKTYISGNRPTAVFFSSLLIILTAACADAAAFANNEKLNNIFAAAIEAVGGEKEIRKIRSIEAVADCTGPKGKYTTKVISYRDGKTRFKQDFTYRDPADIFINDKLIWKRDAKTGEFSLAGPMDKLVTHLHEYQLMAFDFQKMFHDFALVGDEVFENRPSVKISAKTEIENTIYLYFDVETKLLSGYVMPIPGSTATVKNVFNEWKTIGKVKLPSLATATDSSGTWVLNFRTITLNKTKGELFDVPARIKDLSELLELHNQAKTAHLTYNAKLLTDTFNEQLTQVQRGAVSVRTKAENLARFEAYFGQFKFFEWENINPPVIKISKDGTMATVLVQKRVRGSYKDEKGQEITSHTEFAWLEVWEKPEGKWKLMTIASTDKAVTN